jgi:iron complex transport system substrate-binding protein
MKVFNYMLIALALIIFGCQNPVQETDINTPSDVIESGKVVENMRIVSLSGALTEIVFSLGEGENIVATDVTSTFPEQAAQLPKVGHNRNISIEGVLAQQPTVILGFKGEVDEQIKSQFLSANVRVVLFEREFSVDGVKKLIDAVNDSLQIGAKTNELKHGIDQSLSQVEALEKNKRVLFIYARGAGTLMVAGQNTPVHEVIQLAGAENTAGKMDGFKPLTPEALAATNPEVLVLFESGARSLSGWEGLMKIPGMDQTIAGKNQNMITMDGQFLAGFTDRVGEAALKLNQEIRNLGNTNVQ